MAGLDAIWQRYEGHMEGGAKQVHYSFWQIIYRPPLWRWPAGSGTLDNRLWMSISCFKTTTQTSQVLTLEKPEWP